MPDLREKLKKALSGYHGFVTAHPVTVIVGGVFITRTLRPIGLIPAGTDVLVYITRDNASTLLPDANARVRVLHFPDDECVIEAFVTAADVDMAAPYQAELSRLLSGISTADLETELKVRKPEPQFREFMVVNANNGPRQREELSSLLCRGYVIQETVQDGDATMLVLRMGNKPENLGRGWSFTDLKPTRSLADKASAAARASEGDSQPQVLEGESHGK